MHNSRWLLLLAGLTLLTLLPGCSKPSEVEVKGKVFLNDKPVYNVAVSFWIPGERFRRASTTCDRDGNFTLRCPPGSYQVTVEPISVLLEQPGSPEGSGTAEGSGPATRPMVRVTGPAIPKKYRDRNTTDLTIDVPEDGIEGVVFSLRK